MLTTDLVTCAACGDDFIPPPRPDVVAHDVLQPLPPINLAGRPERVLSPSQTAAFEAWMPPVAPRRRRP